MQQIDGFLFGPCSTSMTTRRLRFIAINVVAQTNIYIYAPADSIGRYIMMVYIGKYYEMYIHIMIQRYLIIIIIIMWFLNYHCLHCSSLLHYAETNLMRPALKLNYTNPEFKKDILCKS